MPDAAAALAFRAAQHGGTPAVVVAHGAGAPHREPLSPDEDGVDLGPPDAERVVLHFDCDAFYAQCEELRDPTLCDVPMVRRLGRARTRKHTCIRLCSTADASLRRCGRRR